METLIVQTVFTHLEQKIKLKISKYNLGEKSMKVPFVIYPDLDSLLEKMKTCHDNPEKS